MDLLPQSGAVDLESVFVTAELSRRPSRPPDHEAENRTLVMLAQEMGHSPEDILQKLVDAALVLCRADSAGVSLAEEDDGRQVFRWHAIAGLYAPHRWGTTPREFSPCGTVLDRNAALLVSYPDRYFTYLAEADPRIVEGLLIPFAVSGKPVGTIWVLSHDESHKFDSEDLRVMGNLGRFAEAAYQTLFSLGDLEAARGQLETVNAHLLQANQDLRREMAEHERSRESLKEADSRKDEFLALLAHELRNPLAPIRNAVQILYQEEAVKADRLRARDVIDRQVQQMARLVDDLLDVSRITRGKIELRKERVELAAVVQSALEASRPLIESCGHQVTVALPSRPVSLDADPTRLAQVLSNLLNNAAKYTEPGGRISLTAEQDGEEVVFKVRDNGIGIPAALLPRIFEMFTQADSSLERTQGGLGIGLALARRLVEMHGGTIEAHSGGTGQGSELIVRCPAAVKPSRPEKRPRAKERATTAGASGCRVLVVDDNRDSVDSLRILLELLGHEVSTAYDGLEAVSAAEAFVPHLVLLDIGLPRMNGYEAARRIREQPWGRDVMLVALTGWGQEEDKRRSEAAGFNVHLTKPLDPTVLERLLATVVSGA